MGQGLFRWPITKPEYIDAGDTVVARFTVSRTKRRTIRFNEAPPGRKMSLRSAEICHFDKKGKAVHGATTISTRS